MIRGPPSEPMYANLINTANVALNTITTYSFIPEKATIPPHISNTAFINFPVIRFFDTKPYIHHPVKCAFKCNYIAQQLSFLNAIYDIVGDVHFGATLRKGLRGSIVPALLDDRCHPSHVISVLEPRHKSSLSRMAQDLSNTLNERVLVYWKGHDDWTRANNPNHLH